ncbi:MAG: prolyl oligopeptidase family serine peptidase [Roseiflexaceae bacterium]
MSPNHHLNALLALPSIYHNAAISRDGKWAAWTWYRTGPTADVYVVPTDGSTAPIRLTETSEDTELVAWTPDNRAVLVKHDQQGDERVQLFRVDLERPGVLIPLTEPTPSYYIQGGMLHPNGRWLFYGANVNERGEEIETSWIYRHDLATGERRVLARPQQPGAGEPLLNEQGTHILYQRQDLHPGGSQIWMVDVEGQDDHEVLNVGDSAKVQATWLPDGWRALVLAEAGDHRRVGVWERTSSELRWLIDDPQRNIEDAFAAPGSPQPIATIVELQGARDHATLLNVDSGEELHLPAISGNLVPLRQLDDGAWVGQFFSSTQPSDIVRFALDDLQPTAFTSLTRVWERTSLTKSDLAPAEDFRWRSVDGLDIQGWLYRAREPKGTIIHVHGGPTWLAEDRVNAEIQFYVAQGFNVLAPNYRGSTGFGLEFQESIKQDGWGGREQDDIRAGIEALIAAGIAAPGRVGVTGTSYGGYSSWCAITRWPTELVAAAAPICGMTDLVIDYETTRPDLRSYSAEMLGGRPDQVPERYHERSPIHFMGNIRGHVLIVQGLRDPNVTPENVRAAGVALQASGVEFQTLVFEDEGHGISRPHNQKVLYEQLAAFFGEAFVRSDR